MIFLLLILMIAVSLLGKNESYEQQMIKRLATCIPIEAKYIDELLDLADSSAAETTFTSDTNMLFQEYPALQKKIPYIRLGTFPTSIIKLNTLAKIIRVPNLYIKFDGHSGKTINGKQLFGGNKVRKLEFLLADALSHKAHSVLTFGCIGSNHATATATYAQHLGLQSILMLKPQPNNPIVQRNLMLNAAAGAQMTLSPTNNLRALATITECCNHKLTYGSLPYIIPTGGSCPVGILGFVNAMFELKEQIKQGAMPEPHRIYVPLGSTGTMVGMLIGAGLTGLKSKIIGIAVFPEDDRFNFVSTIQKLFDDTIGLLQSADMSLPKLTCNLDKHAILYDFTGPDYGVVTHEGLRAQELLQSSEKLLLDDVYTAKAFAGMLTDLEKNKPEITQSILFWNTFYADNCSLNDSDISMIPACFHCYFN